MTKLAFPKPIKKKKLTLKGAKARAWKCKTHGKVEYWENMNGFPICKLCKRIYDKKYKSDPLKKEKIRVQNNEARIQRKKANPVYAKAISLGSGLKWGRGGTARLIALITLHLGENCKYCGEELTLKRISLDHKLPFIRSKKRGKARTKIEYSEEQEKFLNSEANIQFICLVCNRRKSNMTDKQFGSLIEFLNKDPEMKKLVLARLGMANFRWANF